MTAIDGYQMARRARRGPRWPSRRWGRSLRARWRHCWWRCSPAAYGHRAEIRRGGVFQPDGAGLVSAIALAHGSILKALAMVVLG